MRSLKCERDSGSNGCAAQPGKLTVRSSRIQWDFQFVSEPMGIKRAAGKVSSFYLDRRNFPPAIIDAKNQRFSFWSLVDIHFSKANLALLEKLLHAAAVAAPSG